MKNYISCWKTCIVIITLAACNESGSNESERDTIPSVVIPPVTDTSSVKTTPSVNDSNAVNTDSLGTSR